jgi:spore coat polysaccharide biosynthesis protein SpsF
VEKTLAGPVVALVQARMSSSRLPGKVILPLGDSTLLDHLLLTLRRVPELDEIIIATSVGSEDDAIVEVAERNSLPYFRGSRDDVLSRMAGAASLVNPSYVVRITADCPLTDPRLVSKMVEMSQRLALDYNTAEEYPRGLGDIEVATFEALLYTAQHAYTPYDREHVFPFIVANPGRYRLHTHYAPLEVNRPHYRLCVDEWEDYLLIQEVWRRLAGSCTVERVVALLDSWPDLIAINKYVLQRTGTH